MTATDGAVITVGEKSYESGQMTDAIPLEYGKNNIEITVGEKVTKITVTRKTKSTDPDIIPGDIDGDKRVTVSDIVMLRAIIMNDINATEEQMTAGDLDDSGTLTVTDIVVLRKLIMGSV